jgi:hypothetical protein
VDLERRDPLGAAAHGDQLETIDAEVVLRLRLDIDLVQARHRPIAGGLEEAHSGRSIFERPDEYSVSPGFVNPSTSDNAIRYESSSRIFNVPVRMLFSRPVRAIVLPPERHLTGGRLPIGMNSRRTSVPAGA